MQTSDIRIKTINILTACYVLALCDNMHFEAYERCCMYVWSAFLCAKSTVAAALYDWNMVLLAIKGATEAETSTLTLQSPVHDLCRRIPECDWNHHRRTPHLIHSRTPILFANLHIHVHRTVDTEVDGRSFRAMLLYVA